MKKGNAKRIFALVLTVIMTLGSLTAGLTFFAGAAEGGSSSAQIDLDFTRKTGTVYTPNISGQILKRGKYYIYNSNSDTVLVATNGSSGLNASDDVTISGSTLSTFDGRPVTVTVADAANNLYYLQNSDGKYISVTASGAVLSDSAVAVKAVTSTSYSGYIGIADSTGTYFLNASSAAYNASSTAFPGSSAARMTFYFESNYYEYVEYAVPTSGQLLTSGNYVIYNAARKWILTDTPYSTDGGINALTNGDQKIKGNTIAAGEGEIFMVTVEDSTKNLYTFQTQDGRYLSISEGDKLTDAKLVTPKTTLQVSSSNYGLIIGIQSKANCLNAYGNDAFGGYYSDYPTSGMTLYAEREVVTGYALTGQTEFTVTQGDYINIDSILSKAQIVQLKNGDDVEIPWNDKKVTYEWDTFENLTDLSEAYQDPTKVNLPGKYFLWVYYDNVLVDKITVNVEPETPVSQVPAANESFRVRLFNYGSAINKYTDGQDETNFLNFFEYSVENVDGVRMPNGISYTSKPLLGSDGCPVINAGGYNRSLGYLFDPNMGAETDGFVQGNGTATEYDPLNNSDYQSMKFEVGNENGSGLFQCNEDGYYYYDSQQNAAWYNPETGLFELYDYVMHPLQGNGDDSGGNFFPFNKAHEQGNVVVPETENNKDLYRLRGDAKHDEGIITYEDSNDMWFGMSIGFDFYMPENGIVDGKETKFNFAGDDDVWVYIDDVLVLDMGGTHPIFKGSINFATGEVYYEHNSENADGEGQDIVRTTIKQCFQNAYGSSLDSTILKGNTLADYSRHTIRFFYMERGGNLSDCKVEFNVPPVPSGSFEVSKKAIGYPDDAVHTFYLTDESGNPIADTEFTGYSLVDTTLTFTGKTDDNGMFTIHSDESAVFNFEIGTKVRVREKKPIEYCETTCEVNGSSYELNENLSTELFEIEAAKGTFVKYYNNSVYIEPTVVVLDYGKPITTYPLENDYRGFKVNGITAEAPGEDVKTTDELTLNNGVAVLDESVTPELPTGDLVAEIGVNDTKIFYPGTEKTTTVAYSANLRYQFTDGKIEKNNNFDDEPTIVTEGLEDKRFAVDTVDDNLKYAFYRNGDTIYVMKNPEIIEGTKTAVETVTEYVKATPQSTGQVLEEGNYYFMLKNGTLLLTGSNNSSNGGIVGSGDFSITDNILTTSQDAKIKVTLADKTKNTYYLQNSNNQYLNVTQADSASGATFTNTKTAVRVIYNNGCVVIANASNDYYLNRYGGSGTVYGAYNYIDDGCRFNCYKETAREVELSTDEYFYELTDAGDPIQTTGLSTTAKQILNLNGAVFKATSQSSGRYYTVSVTGPSNVSIGSLTSNNTSFTYNYSSDDIKDKYGNSISIPITFTRTTNTSISVSYPEYKLVENPYLLKEDDIKMRNTLDSVTYTPFKYMSSIDRVYFYAYKEGFGDGDSANESLGRLFSTITYIPATTVYYEDNFGGSEENGGLYINYTGDWYTVNDDGTQVKDITVKVDSDEYQDRGEVGDGHTPYGHDSSYDGFTKFSNGSAAYVEGVVDAKTKTYYSKAKFTFTGTGFDLISRTDMDCGQIIVQVYQGENFLFNIPVLNKGIDTLYQIPVISCTGLDYGTYDITINVTAAVTKPAALARGNHFYLDAIRIYDPMGLSSDDNPEFTEAYNAYHDDNEANPFVGSIRDFIIDSASLGNLEGFEDEITGAVYVDTYNNEYDKEENQLIIGNIKKPEYTDEQRRWRNIDTENLNSFELVGPNEEVYLTPGYGIGFKIETDTLPKSVQLGIKVPKAVDEPKSTMTAQTYGYPEKLITLDVKSSVEMFYDITNAVVFTESDGKYTATVILSNGLPALHDDDIVSITNLKMTFANSGAVVTPVKEEESSLKMAEASDAPRVALKASQEIYKQVFDTVYVQKVASIPNFDIENLESDSSVCNGGYANIQFNTAKSVNEVELVDENGKAVALTEVTSTLNSAKTFTDDYQNAKTWRVKARVLSTEGDHELTLRAVDGAGESAKVSINVTPAEIAEMRVVKMPAKTTFNYGEALDFTGLEIERIYTDGKVETVTEGFDLTESENEHGTKVITASFGGVSVEFDVEVVPVITGIRIGKAPATTNYKFDSRLDAKGLELIVTYSDGYEETVTEGYKLNKTTADTEGVMNVGVEYEGFETQFDVNVKLTFLQKLVRFFNNIFTQFKNLFAKIF